MLKIGNGKISYDDLCLGLDRLYFLPLHLDETIEIRQEAISAFMVKSGWTWDQLMDEMAKLDIQTN